LQRLLGEIVQPCAGTAASLDGHQICPSFGRLAGNPRFILTALNENINIAYVSEKLSLVSSGQPMRMQPAFSDVPNPIWLGICAGAEGLCDTLRGTNHEHHTSWETTM